MKENILKIGLVSVFCLLAYGGWQLKRSFNYSFDYESKVIETIEKKYENRILNLEREIKLLKK